MLYAQRAFPQTLSDSGVRHGCFPATAGAFRSKPQTSSLAHSGARPHLLKVLQNAFQQILANSGTLPNACPQTLAFRNKPKVLSSQALADSRPAHEPCIGIYKRSRLPEQNETPHPPRLLTFRAQQAAGRLWWRIQRITAKWREIVWHDMHRGRPFPPRSKIRLTASFERVVRSSTRLSAGIPPMPSFCDRVPFLARDVANPRSSRQHTEPNFAGRHCPDTSLAPRGCKLEKYVRCVYWDLQRIEPMRWIGRARDTHSEVCQ